MGQQLLFTAQEPEKQTWKTDPQNKWYLSQEPQYRLILQTGKDGTSRTDSHQINDRLTPIGAFL